MKVCKFYRRNGKGNGYCALLVSPIGSTFEEIKNAFKKHCKGREMAPNGECFWKDDEFELCPRYNYETDSFNSL